MSRKITVGIDPGKQGGIAIIHDDVVLEAYKMRESYEYIQVIEQIIKEYSEDNLIFVVEKVGAMPGQGVVSMFTFGYGYGYLIAVLETLTQKITDVSPLVWKKYYKIPGKKQGLAECKSATIKAVAREFPDYYNASKSNYHSGIYDALLIARHYHITKRSNSD